MSVYQRNRSISSVEYHYKATQIYPRACKVAVSRHIPKTYRFVLSVPFANTARDLLYHINKAEEFKESDRAKFIEHLQYAHAACTQAFDDLQCILEVLPETKPSSFLELLDMLDKESTLLENKIG